MSTTQTHRGGTDGRELEPLTDSLSSIIRWRYSDYGSILKSELELLAQTPSLVEQLPQSAPIVERG